MSGYSGKASFDFEIERYKDKKTGDIFNLAELRACQRTAILMRVK